jgi:hypothetical protein
MSNTDLQCWDGGRRSNSESLCSLMKRLCANCHEGVLNIHRHAHRTLHIRTDCFCRADEPLNERRVPTLGRCPVCVSTRTDIDMLKLIYCIIYRVSQNLCHKIFLGIPHPHLSKKVPINMGPKVNRFRDIHCCVEIRKMLWLTFQPHSTISLGSGSGLTGL